MGKPISDQNSPAARDVAPPGVIVLRVEHDRTGRATLIAQARELGWPVVNATTPGEVLRRLWQAPPRAAVLHVADVRALDDASAIVRAVRARRPLLPLVCVTPRHSEQLERDL